MRDEEIPNKIRNIVEKLNGLENNFDEMNFDDDLLMMDHFHPFRRFWPDITLNEIISEDGVNIIPSSYGKRGECQDTLLVFIEPSFMIFQGDEYHPEMRIKKRIETALDFINRRCNSVKYIIFWASVWEFRIWKKYKKEFQKNLVILKPWGLSHITLL
jgi:hypothetical protein